MYAPSENILKKYADVLVKFALGSGQGIKKGEAIFLQVPESAKSILNPLVLSVLESGGYPIISFTPEGTDRWMSVDRVFLENASNQQTKYLPKNYLLGRIKDSDHMLYIISTNNKHDLEGVDSKKIMLRQAAVGFYKDARDKKENAGKLTWTLALFGTEAMAKEAGLTLRQYWDQIIKACFLDKPDPIAKWKSVFANVEKTREKLSKLEIEELFIKGKTVDLTIKIGRGRKWLGGSGRNIPSFEIFTSPDWRATEGWVKFSEALYVYGNLVENVELEFKKGRVVKVNASKNKNLVAEMIKVPGADKVGEFSLTDRRFSKITHFMAETLFDENMGGKFGNFHLALGSAYKDAYTGDSSKISKKNWEALGYNESSVHTDIISTDDKTVTAVLESGKSKVIYRNGMFDL
jgi:aminopeptidase